MNIPAHEQMLLTCLLAPSILSMNQHHCFLKQDLAKMSGGSFTLFGLREPGFEVAAGRCFVKEDGGKWASLGVAEKQGVT